MVTWENYEEYMMMQADGELNAAYEQELQHFISQHPELADEQALYHTVRLQPDEEMVMPNKELLLKQEEPNPRRRIALSGWWAYGAAASVVAALILFSVLRKGNNNTDTLAQATYTTPATVPVQSPASVTQQPAITAQQSVAVSNPKPFINHIQHKAPKPIITNNQPSATPAITHDVAAITPLTVHPITVTSHPQPALATVQPVRLKQPEITQPSDNQNNDKSLLAMLPIDDSKKQGIQTVKNVVVTSINEVKNFKENIRQTDIAFSIKGKQIAVINF